MRTSTKLLLLTSIVPGVLAGCASSEPSGDVTDGPATGDAVEVVAGDSFFEPESLKLDAGETATVEVTNEGDSAHDFSIDALDISTGSIDPGQVKTISFEVPEGTTEFVCSYHPGMAGTISTR